MHKKIKQSKPAVDGGIYLHKSWNEGRGHTDITLELRVSSLIVYDTMTGHGEAEVRRSYGLGSRVGWVSYERPGRGRIGRSRKQGSDAKDQ